MCVQMCNCIGKLCHFPLCAGLQNAFFKKKEVLIEGTLPFPCLGRPCPQRSRPALGGGLEVLPVRHDGRTGAVRAADALCQMSRKLRAEVGLFVKHWTHMT